MEKKKEITWYIFADGSYTNEVIGKDPEMQGRLDGTGGVFMCYDEKGESGEERPLWECSRSFITRMQKSKSEKKLSFTVYKKEGKYGKIKKFKIF